MTTIFLDRDGVINENRSDYVKSWSEFHFLPQVQEAIAELTFAGHRIIVCTNQPGIARGQMTREVVEDIHRRMIAELALYNGHIEGIYCCFHKDEDHCSCRKPRPGLLLKARDELGIDFNDAIFIGDSITDVKAGSAAGVRTMLVLTGLGIEQLRNHRHDTSDPFLVTMNLKHAVDVILKQQSPCENISTREENKKLPNPRLILR